MTSKRYLKSANRAIYQASAKGAVYESQEQARSALPVVHMIKKAVEP